MMTGTKDAKHATHYTCTRNKLHSMTISRVKKKKNKKQTSYLNIHMITLRYWPHFKLMRLVIFT